jgi:hypothetical protein
MTPVCASVRAMDSAWFGVDCGRLPVAKIQRATAPIPTVFRGST